MAYRPARLVVCLFWFAFSQLTVAAETEKNHAYLERQFSLDLGIFYPDRKLDLRVNGSVPGFKDEIDFDEGLGLKNAHDIFSGQVSWRFRDRWSVTGQYFRATDGSRVVLEEDIEWGNVVFNAGSFAAAGSDFSLSRIFVGRRFDTGERHEIGVGGGIHWLHIGAYIAGEILINGTPVSARRAVSEEAPLPNIGIWYDYSISPRWAFRSRFDLLSADVGDYDGLMVNASIGVNYQAFEHLGIGLNYNYFELDVTIDKSNWKGNVETIYEGVYVYASLYF
jgi:hypothetical protein